LKTWQTEWSKLKTVPGTEDRVEKLDQIAKIMKKMLRKYEWDMQDFWDTMKRPNL
jgi:hypothetical protein